ncbi:MAG: hypothetical protein DMG57_25470 [Acidobacteria bacterium]|nr:MAG: hypothetical protein DMG57_25470 [Acidobacteriota bacterium]
MLRWASENLLQLKPEEIGEHYGRYRLHVPEAERAMAKSLERYGQLSPVVVCRRGERYELIDGFKRLGAARRLTQLDHLSASLMEADERTVKAAIYGLNRVGGRTRELEEAWIIHALVREDGMSQVEAAELLGRHKSWVCRRLALIERLGAKAREELHVGLLSPTAARQIVRLPQGNQAEVLDAARLKPEDSDVVYPPNRVREPQLHIADAYQLSLACALGRDHLFWAPGGELDPQLRAERFLNDFTTLNWLSLPKTASRLKTPTLSRS